MKKMFYSISILVVGFTILSTYTSENRWKRPDNILISIDGKKNPIEIAIHNVSLDGNTIQAEMDIDGTMLSIKSGPFSSRISKKPFHGGKYQLSIDYLLQKESYIHEKKVRSAQFIEQRSSYSTLINQAFDLTDASIEYDQIKESLIVRIPAKAQFVTMKKVPVTITSNKNVNTKQQQTHSPEHHEVENDEFGNLFIDEEIEEEDESENNDDDDNKSMLLEK